VVSGCGSSGVQPSSTAGGQGGQVRASRRPDSKRGCVWVGHNADPVKALTSALTAAGALKAVIKPGDKVVLKPNAAWARTPEQAATTDPRLVGAMVKLCKDAGASQVVVYEYTIDRPSSMVLGMSGIGAAASQAGAEVRLAARSTDFQPVSIPKGKLLKSDTMAKALLEADVVINMPKAKRHSQTGLTLGLKNMMGVIWDRQAWHAGPDLHQFIADYSTAAPLDLTVIDASRILLTNGPKGPGRTKDTQEVIVAFDPVAADAYACSLFGVKPADVPYIVKAGALGVGESDATKLKIVEV